MSVVGGIGLFLSRIGYVSPEGVNKGASEVSDGSNSIAAAVAKVLPAIVLISVHKSKFKMSLKFPI